MPIKDKIKRAEANYRYQKNLKFRKEKVKTEKLEAENFVCIMSNLSNIHKTVLESMKFSADHFTGEVDLSELAGDMAGDKDKARILSSITPEDMEKYAKGVRGDNAMDINAGRRVKSMKNTNQELKAVDEAIEEAQKTREQLLLNKQAIMASLSNKALKVVEVAHARLVLQRATALVKMSSKESTPTNSRPSSPSALIVAEEGKNEPSTAGGGGVLSSAFS